MGSLKKFDGSSWINSSLRKLTTDTDTFTTFPAIIYAEGTNATVGLKGNTVQSGTPTPDNPVMPQGTGERTGNLFPEYPAQTEMLDGVNWNVSSNGKITGNGTTTSGTNFYILRNYSIPLKAGTYTLSFVGRKNISLILRNVTTSTIICGAWSTNSSATFTIDNDIPVTDKINLYFNTSQAGISVDVDGYTMLNLGSTALPYEPYGYKIPISSANTTTPVYLGEVETTRRIRKLVLTGEENWISDGEFFHTNVNSLDFRNTTNGLMCSHLPIILRDDFNRQPSAFWGKAQAGDVCLCISNAITTLDAFKSYLTAQYAAGTPVTVWYVLANEETGIVNEPLMRIGDYADTLSNISIPVTAGGDTLSVGTTVQPSEVTANYYGWHTITVHERESGQWD